MDKQKFKRLLRNTTQCIIQHNGWTCAGCFFSIDKSLTNADWQSVLFYRGDYSKKQLDNLPLNYKTNLENIQRIMKENE